MPDLNLDGTVVPERVVLAAERDVRLATRAAIYRTNPTGEAIDPVVAKALTDARDEQIRARLAYETALETVAASAALSPLGVPLQSASIEGASYTAATTDATQLIPPHLHLDVASGLCRAAYDVLLDAGLIGGPVIAYG